MAQFDTDHILSVITHETLSDHETNRVVLESFLSACDREITHVDLVREVLGAVLRQAAQSSHGRDLVVGLVDRFVDESRCWLRSSSRRQASSPKRSRTRSVTTPRTSGRRRCSATVAPLAKSWMQAAPSSPCILAG